MGAHSQLGEFEQLVLLAILQLDDEAFGPAVGGLLEEAAARPVSRGALYSALARLEQKGFVEWEVEAATSERGGNRSRRFAVTEPGLRALRSARQALLTLWEGLDAKLDGRAR
jgi:DNA-binding PadR family transcriptional regulator